MEGRREGSEKGRERGKEKEVSLQDLWAFWVTFLIQAQLDALSMRVKKPDLGVRWVGPQIPVISGISSQPVPLIFENQGRESKGKGVLTGLCGLTGLCVSGMRSVLDLYS